MTELLNSLLITRLRPETRGPGRSCAAQAMRFNDWRRFKPYVCGKNSQLGNPG